MKVEDMPALDFWREMNARLHAVARRGRFPTVEELEELSGALQLAEADQLEAAQ
jgi:hypothetical protein